ncbi:MAG: ABC transporter permease [Acidimicrobiales bacterium]
MQAIIGKPGLLALIAGAVAATGLSLASPERSPWTFAIMVLAAIVGSALAIGSREGSGALAVVGVGSTILWAFVERPPISWTFALIVLVGTAAAFLTNGRYAVRRVLGIVPIMLVVSFVVFSLMASLPGDPAINILGPSATPDAVARVNAEMGLDEPFFNRYGNWLGDAVMGDLGTSILLREDVADGVSRSITPSLQLMLYALILATLISFPLGVFTAYRNGQRVDRSINTVMLGFFAVPPFVLAIFFILFLAIGGVTFFGTDFGLKILPGSRYVPFGQSRSDHFKHMLLPALSLALGQSAVFMRLLRADMIGTLRQPFIDLARSKGLKTRRILWRHALRPSLFTLLTVMGFTVGALIGGALITEIIFVLPGIGGYMFNAISQRDFIAVQGGTMVIATLYILILVMVDFSYLALDPRLRTGGSGLGGNSG